MRKLARAIAARTEPRFITIPPQRGGSRVHYTEEQLAAMRGGLTVERYRLRIIRKFGKTVMKSLKPKGCTRV
jgi:hypothetical protein